MGQEFKRYAVKVREDGEKGYKFIAPDGTLTTRRSRAALAPGKEAAEDYAAYIRRLKGDAVEDVRVISFDYE